jgi:hypothetical protein
MTTDNDATARRICQPGEDSDNVKIDREFAAMIPPLSPSELADLHRSLAEEGCRDALIVWKGENLLLDGHNRLRWCREHKKPFSVVERAFADRLAAKACIIREQLGRRNLSPLAVSYLRGKRYLELKKQGERTDLTSGHFDPKKRVSEQLAEEFGVGERTIRRDAKFAEAVDKIVKVCKGESRNLLLARDTGLTRGGVLRLAKQGPEEQKQFLEALKEGKRPRRKAAKGKRRARLTLPAQPKALVRALVQQLGPKELAEVARGLAEAMEGKKVETQGQAKTRPDKQQAEAGKRRFARGKRGSRGPNLS